MASVSWIGPALGAVVVEDRAGTPVYALDVLDLSRGTWSVTRLPPTVAADAVSSDGMTILARLDSGGAPGTERLLLLFPSRSPIEVSLAGRGGWAQDWAFWGTFSARPAGGYLLARTTVLALVDDAGGVHVSALPEGYITQAATSDPERFLLGRRGGDNGAEARSIAATGLYLWDRKSGTLNKVTDTAKSVAVARDGSLAFIQGNDGGWMRLAGSGKLERTTEASNSESSIAPGGSLVMVPRSTGETGCDTATLAGCGTSLVAVPTMGELGRGPGPVGSGVAWSEERAAYATASIPNGAEPKVVVLTRAGAQSYGLPASL